MNAMPPNIFTTEAVARMLLVFCFMLFTGCVTIQQPEHDSTVISPISARVVWGRDMQDNTFFARVDTTDVTSSFTVDNANHIATAPNIPLALGNHSLEAGGNLLSLFGQGYNAVSDKVNFTVVVPDMIVVDTIVPGQEVGILYDGADTQGSFNDRGAIVTANTTTATVRLPNIQAPAFGNSLVAFSRSRQPRWGLAPWTANSDTVYVPLQNNIRFNVTFWILAGTFTTQQTNAAAAVLAVNNAYTDQKAGVRIGFVTINDATANPTATALMNYPGATMQQFETGIGFNPREINIYVIDTVLGGSGTGVNFDGYPVILLGQNSLTFPQVLEHEIGHAFALGHVGMPDFNWQNVMWPVISAHFLTEGQNFRMHFHPSSQINVFNLRPGLPTFVCGVPADDNCPATSRRLWQDGDLPPN